MDCFKKIKHELTKEDLCNWKLPISQTDFIISQGFGGPYSHFKIRENTDLTYSIDFVVPPESEVLASKQGIILSFMNDGDKFYRGKDINIAMYYPANKIVIGHKNGIYSLYEHLSKEGFSKYNIYEGKKVKQGEIIGSTGLSGWIGLLPHLHFNAFCYKPDPRFRVRLETIPIKFSNYNKSLWNKDLNLQHIFNKIITNSCA